MITTRTVLATFGILLALGMDVAAQTTIDDQTKRVALQAPDGWLLAEESSPRQLTFVGPRVSGVTSSLAVFPLPGESDLEGGLPALVEWLELSEPSEPEDWNIGGAAQLFEHAILIDHKLARKGARTGVAAYRHGPGLLVMAFTGSASRWGDIEADVLGALQSVVPERWEPTYADPKLGLWLFNVLEYGALNEKRTRAGSMITWEVLTDAGNTRAEMIVRTVDGVSESDFADWLDEREKAWPSDGRVVEIDRRDTRISGLPAARFRVVVDYGSTRNTALETCVFAHGKVIRVQCQCLEEEYPDGFGPHFEWMHDGLAVQAP